MSLQSLICNLSFIAGSGTVLRLFPNTRKIHNLFYRPFTSSEEAIRHDFQMIGSSLAGAILKHEQAKRKEENIR